MFTGIVEEVGSILRMEPGNGGCSLEIGAQLVVRDLPAGGSLAVNGCCLTATSTDKASRIRFHLCGETWERTGFRFLSEGSPVNLERPLKADGRLGGHMVAGHVDGTARVAGWTPKGEDHLLDVEAPASLMRYIVAKGSVCLDGISLTVAEVGKRGFRAWIIPHTRASTNLGSIRVGARMNLETDILARHVERLLEGGRDGAVSRT